MHDVPPLACAPFAAAGSLTTSLPAPLHVAATAEIVWKGTKSIKLVGRDECTSRGWLGAEECGCDGAAACACRSSGNAAPAVALPAALAAAGRPATEAAGLPHSNLCVQCFACCQPANQDPHPPPAATPPSQEGSRQHTLHQVAGRWRLEYLAGGGGDGQPCRPHKPAHHHQGAHVCAWVNVCVHGWGGLGGKACSAN
jgi:hypothetical protein